MDGSRRTGTLKPAEMKPVGKPRKFSVQHSVSECQSCHRRLEADAGARRLQKLLPVMMIVLLVVCTSAIYVVVMLSGSYDVEDKERAEQILTPIIACLLGYVSGSSKNK